MATWGHYYNSFEGNDLGLVGSMQGYLNYDKYVYFYEFVSLPNQDVIDLLLEQTTSGQQISYLSTFIRGMAQSVKVLSLPTEAQKWEALKAIFSEGVQPAIQVIIDKETLHTIPATLFDDFADMVEADHAQNILDMHTAPSDFWTTYIAYFKRRADEFQDGWSLWLSRFSGDYRVALARIVSEITNNSTTHGFEDYTDFELFKTIVPSLFAEKVFPFEGEDTLPYNYLTQGQVTNLNYDLLVYLSSLIRANLDQAFNGYYSTTLDRQNAFIELFKPELQVAVLSFIDTLISKGYITSFDGLGFLPASTRSSIVNIDLPDLSTAQQDELSDFCRYIVSIGDIRPLSTGDVLAFSINGSDIIGFKVNNPENIDTDLTTFINDTTTGGWSVVSATFIPGYVQVLANAVNTPFIIQSESIFSTLVGYTHYSESSSSFSFIGRHHPFYLAVAQMILNDANATDTSNLQVTKSFKGRVFYKNDRGVGSPAANTAVTVYDIDNISSPENLGTVLTDAQGNFTLSYTLVNASKPQKALRLEAKDSEGNVLLITTDQESNLFTDATNGSFEGGTAPAYSEWNLSLGTDIEIVEAEFLGPELQENSEFDESEGGWYTDYPQTTLFNNTTSGYIPFSVVIPYVYTGNILIVGRRYRVRYVVYNQGVSPNFGIFDTDSNLFYSSSSFVDNQSYEVDFVATTNSLYISGIHLGIDSFSIKEILTESSAYEGAFSPQFLLNASAPTDDFIFKGNTSIAVTTNTDYEIEAYVFFNYQSVDSIALLNSGLYLRPVSYSFGDLTQTIVHNGTHALEYVSGEVKSNKEVALGQWVRITSKFNSASNTSITLGVYLKGTLGDFVPNFNFAIDQVRLVKGAAVSKDLSLLTSSNSAVNVYTVPINSSQLDAAIAQEATASLPQINNVFPADVQVGDLFILDLNHAGEVSYKAAVASVADVTAGLTAAITAETSDVTITTRTAAGPSDAQFDWLSITDVKIGAKYTFRLNGLAPVSYVASAAGTTANVTAGVTAAINEQTANVAIVEDQATSFSQPQILHITPQDVLLGAKFILEINGDTKVEYTAVAATVADVVAGLVSAINTGAGDWTKVTATNGGPNTHVIITGNTNNVAFDIVQKGGGWKSVYAADQSAGDRVVVTARVDNTPFVVDQVGGKWKSVFATDETNYLTVTADANDTPFDLYVKVVKAAEAGTTISTALDSLDIVLSEEVTNAFLLKGITTINDILFAGGLKNNIDGLLKLEIKQKATVSLPHIIWVTPTKVAIGDIFKLTINATDTVTYVATAATTDNVIAGLVSLINAASGGWTSVTATDLTTGTLTIIADSNDVVFTLIQSKAGLEEDIQKLDTVASLSTLANDIGFSDETKLLTIKKLIEAGFDDALSISDLNKENFITTINEVVGDFNASRLYELALIRKDYTTQLVNDFMASQQVYQVNKTGTSNGSSAQLTSLIEERCACDDCETAVSPLAYLTDLINYVTKNIVVLNRGIGSAYFRLNDKTLSNYFYQDFTELPASCDDVLNRVCQIRVATEVLQRYISATPPSTAELIAMNLSISNYVRDLYSYYLIKIGTSYDEVRMITSEKDRKKLALKLGISYDANPDFLEKLFFPPEVIVMADWTAYKKRINGGIQNLITELSLLMPDFSAFKASSIEDVRTQLQALDDLDAFIVELRNLIHGVAANTQAKIDALSIPNELKESLKWETFLYELSELFSVSFKNAFLIFKASWDSVNKGTFDDLVEYLATFFVTEIDLKYSFDFWLPFSAALKYKVEDFSLSQQDIEQLFGLQDSSKDVYSDGAKINDLTNILKRWNLRGILWGKNTDNEGYIYLVMDEFLGVIELYKHVSKTSDYKVGVAVLDSETAKFVISEFNDSGISGELIVTELDGLSSIYISAVPLLLSWKLQGLRQLWLTSDKFDKSPIIDPDLIRASDIVFPFDIDTMDPLKPIDFWQQRTDELSTQYNAYKAAQEAASEISDVFGTGIGSDPTDFNQPNGVAIDANGVVYIADTANDRIQKLEGTTLSTFIGSGLSSPKGLKVTSDQKLIVVDSGNAMIRQYALPGGALEWSYGGTVGTGLGQFTNAFDVALGKKQDLFITDNATVNDNLNPGRIQRFTLPVTNQGYLQTATLEIEQLVDSETDVEQVTRVTPAKVRVGDTFKLTLEGTGSVTYITTTDKVTDLVKGLVSQIEMASWSSVEVEDNDIFITFTAVATNTPFTLTYDSLVPFQGLEHVAMDQEGNRYFSDTDNGRVLQLNKDGYIQKVVGIPHGLSRDVVVLLRFEETSGTTARDSSGSSVLHNATITGTDVEWVTGGVTPGALKLHTDNAVSIASHVALDGANFEQRTIEFWFRADDKDDTNYQVLYKQGDDVKGMNVYLKSGLLYVSTYATGVSNFISTNLVQTGLWQHLVVAFNNAPVEGKHKLRAFLDGKEFVTSGEGDAGTAIEASSSPDGIHLGALISGKIKFADLTVSSPTSDYYYNGLLDNFRLWNRAIDEQEIKFLYNRAESIDGTIIRPGAITADKSGNLYVVDNSNTGILKFDNTGFFVARYGAYGTGDGQFLSPASIAIDYSSKAGTFYVSDAENDTVQKFNSAGYLSAIVPLVAFNTPKGLAVNSNGILYVADSVNHQIKIFDKDGTHIDTYVEFSESGLKDFDTPVALAFDSNDNLIVFDQGLDKLILMENKITTIYSLHGGPWDFSTSLGLSIGKDDYLYLPAGNETITTRFPEQITEVTVKSGTTSSVDNFNTLAGITVDDRDNLWVIDKGNHRVLKLTLKGLYINDIGKEDNSSGTGNGQFNAPEFLSTDESNNLYVSDTGNNRIQKFDEDGEFLSLWSEDGFIDPVAQNSPTGIAVDKNRKVFVAQRGLGVLQGFESMQGLSTAFQLALNISLAELLQLNIRERQGEDIEKQIALYFLSYNAYRHLLLLINFADKGRVLLDEQLEDLYHILVRSYKEAQYIRWKEEEQNAAISLSRDYFEYSNLDEEFVPKQWRSDERERKKWVNTLSDRIEQEAVLQTEYITLLDEVESAFLIRLRNIYIMASSFEGYSFEQKAQSASNKLLLDFKNACCQRTTRVSQAIEVLQNLVWGLKNGIITDNHPDLRNTSSPITFDEEWMWMGSYATWKSAQLVFMYPENLLLPAYHRDSSPGFTKFTEDIRLNARLTAENINDYAADYYTYFDDVNGLNLEAARHAPTFVATKSKTIRSTIKEYRNYIYLVARGAKTKSIYWSILDETTISSAPASSWSKIELENAHLMKVKSLVQIRLPDGKRYLALFLLDDTKEKAKLLYIKYDLEELTWDTEPIEIELEDFNDGYDNAHGAFRGVFVENTGSALDTYRENGDYPGVPNRLTVVLHRGLRQVVYYTDKGFSALKQASSAEAYWDFKLGELNSNNKVYIRTPYVFDYLFYYQDNDHTWVIGDLDGSKIPNINPVQYVGSVSWPDTNDWAKTRRLIFYYNGIDRTNLSYVVLRHKTKIAGPFTIVLPQIDYISQAFKNDAGKIVVLYNQKGSSGESLIKVHEANLSAGHVFSFVSQANVINPKIDIQGSYPQPYTNQSQSYKNNIRSSYNQSIAVKNKYYQRYVEELYYALPMAAAAALQKRGLYQEALDWYRLVYDYSKPSKLDRTVYHGLFAESSALDLIDDFESNRNYPVVSPNTSQELSVGVNHYKSDSNSSDRVGYIKATPAARGGYEYDLIPGHTIDLFDPNFSVYVYNVDGVQVAGAKIEFELGQKNSGLVNYVIYSAPIEHTGWKKVSLNFNSQSNPNYNAINVLRVRIYVPGSANGKLFAIDYIMSGTVPSVLDKQFDWLSDPLNPHALAAQRSDSYNRFTIMSIARCLVEYADSEYAQDTVETVPRARLLYETALELMKDQGLGGLQERCRDTINAFEITVADEWLSVWKQIKNDIYKVKEEDVLKVLLENISVAMVRVGTDPEKLKIVRTMVNSAKDDPQLFRNLSAASSQGRGISGDAYLALQSDPRVYQLMNRAAFLIGQDYLNKVVDVTGVSAEVLLSDRVFDDGTVMAQLKEFDGAISSGIIPLDMITGSVDDLSEEALRRGGDQLNQLLMKDLKQNLSAVMKYDVTYKPSTNFTFCVPANPLVDGLRLKAEINLFKIRTCRNIAGEVRELDPYAAPIDVASGLAALNGGADLLIPQNREFKPSAHRYEALVERAKQLVQIAQQVEASLLASLEKLDAERYNVLKAKQDLSLSKAGIKLQDLRVKEAQSGVKLAELQKDRSQLQVSGLEGLISAGLNDYENTMLDLYKEIETLSSIISSIDAGLGSIGFSIQALAAFDPVSKAVGGGLAVGGAVLSGVKTGLSISLNSANSRLQVASLWSSFERRKQEWEFQKVLATQDVAIGNQQIKIAQEHVAVVSQERQIAQLQTDNAQATIDFLSNKFGNVELYDWMSRVLENTYDYFLKQATSMAKLAADQLAFERQQLIPIYIKSDYWQEVSDNLIEANLGSGDKTVDRKGITGSTRLLQDIYQLDQYAFANDQRKLELTKNISLLRLAPVEFQKFKETGELNFETSMENFDKDFPGHYLRLIRSVKVSVIALVPPLDGIKARLFNTGVSRVVVENNSSFRKIQVKRNPESVSLTSSYNANGLFELNPVGNDKLLPFEKTGVESQWTFQLQKAANFFDFNTIADIVLTIEYTALENSLYRSQVNKDLGDIFQANSSYSFKNNFPDQWYDLNNLGAVENEELETEFSVSFATSLNDFPVNLNKIKITDVLMFFVKSDSLDSKKGKDLDTISLVESMSVNKLSFEADGVAKINTGITTAVAGLISSRIVSGAEWSAVKESSPAGTWTVTFPIGVKSLFDQGAIKDILFVLSYEGGTAAWLE